MEMCSIREKAMCSTLLIIRQKKFTSLKKIGHLNKNKNIKKTRRVQIKTNKKNFG